MPLNGGRLCAGRWPVTFRSGPCPSTRSLALRLLRGGALFLGFRGRGFLLLGFLADADLRGGKGRSMPRRGWGDVRRETPPVEKPTRKSGRRRGHAGPGTRVSRADRASRALGRRWWPLLIRGFGHARDLSTRGTRTSCSMCPMSSSMSDCFSSGWNASPLGPRARAIGAHDPSSFHRAIGRR